MEQTRRASGGIGASWRKAVAAAAAVTLLVGVGFGTALSAHADEANDGGSARVSDTAAPELAPTPTPAAETPDDTGSPAGSPAPEPATPETAPPGPAPESPAPTPGSPVTGPTPAPTDAPVPNPAHDATSDTTSDATGSTKGNATSDAARAATAQRAAPAAATGKIAGVVRSEGGKRLAKVTVRISHTTSNASANVRTRSDGSYSVSKLPAGKYRVEVDTEYSDVNYLFEARTVTVRAKSTTTQNFSLVVGGVLAGTVKDENGAPVKGAWIQLPQDPVDFSLREAFSDGNGKYRIERLRTETVKVTVLSSDELRSVTQEVSIKARTLKAKNFILPNPGVIVGTVTDAATGEPVEGATVYSGRRANANPVDTTDAQGKYRIKGVGAGTQIVTVETPSANFAHQLRTIAVPSVGEITVDFALTEGGVVTGRLVDSSGKGVWDLHFSLNFRDERTGATQTAWAHGGQYRAEGLGTARYRVTLVYNETLDDYDDDYYSYSVDLGYVDAVAGTTITKKFEFERRFEKQWSVKIAGTAKAGYGIRADAESTWSPRPSTFSYRWSRDGVPIGGATDRRYTLKSKDVGKRITVKVTASSPGYKTTSASASAPRITARK